MNRTLLLALLTLVAVQPSLPAQEMGLLKDVKRVVFLGDSNTFAGGFITYLDTFLITRFPDRKFELINLGLPSETVSGLSEPDHPYPRPDVHTRLDKALELTKPDLVVVCYGMNDGIYSPFREERFKKYQDGIERLMAKVKKAGAKVVLMTPAPFDPIPGKKNLLDKEAAKHSWMKPYEDYDQVLRKYSDWLLTLRDRGITVADPHAAVHRFLSHVRKTEPNYTVSGDGIHPNATGHGIIFFELWKTLQLSGTIAELEISLLKNGPKAAEAKLNALEWAWKVRVPMPFDKKWDKRWVDQENLQGQLNLLSLTVLGLRPERMTLYTQSDGREGATKIGTLLRADLAKGVNLAPLLEAGFETDKLLELNEQRQTLLGRAWLTHVGHKRPDTPKGIPLDKAIKQAEELEMKIRKMSLPKELLLGLNAP